jgi:hypothetical protein
MIPVMKHLSVGALLGVGNGKTVRIISILRKNLLRNNIKEQANLCLFAILMV